MSSERKPAQRGSQKERVYARADEIFTMLSRSAMLSTIQTELGMEDMPYPTFARLVKKLKNEAPERLKSPFSEPGFVSSIDRATLPSGTKETAMTSGNDRAKPLQSKGESKVAPESDEPKKVRPKLRKKVPPVRTEPVPDDKGFDPSKWKDLEI